MASCKPLRKALLVGEWLLLPLGVPPTPATAMLRHTSNFGAGPSDAGQFKTSQLSKNAALFALERSSQTFSTATDFVLRSSQEEQA